MSSDQRYAFHSNDYLERYFANELGLRGLNIQSRLFTASAYQKLPLRDMIRGGYSAVANNLSKSLVLLHTPIEEVTSREITSHINNLLGFKTNDPYGFNSLEVDSFLANGIVKLQQYDLILRHTKKFETELVTQEGISARHWGSTSYSKVWDGFLIGDPFAYIGMIASSIEGSPTSRYIFGDANAPGRTNAQENTLLLLYWLSNRGGEGRVKEFVEEVIGYSGPTEAQESITYRSRTVHNIERLVRASMLDYESFSSDSPIIIKLNPDVSYTSIDRSALPLKTRYNPGLIKKIVDELSRCDQGLSNVELSELLHCDFSHVSNMTRTLVSFGYASIVSGHQIEEFSKMTMRSNSYILLDKIQYFMELIGWFDAVSQNNGQITFDLLNKIVRPDLERIWRIRQEKLVDNSKEVILSSALLREKHKEDIKRRRKK